MEKGQIKDAVEDLNLIIFNNDKNSIPTDIDPEILEEKMKQAALWLYASDTPQENTLEVLRSLDWTTDDFENFKKDQNPIPAFRFHGIGPYAKSENPEPEPVPEPEEEPEILEADVVEEIVDQDAAEEEVEEHMGTSPPKTKTKRTGPSAYGTALALMGPDPEMPLHELYEAMKEQGFDLVTATGSIKTAHSIFRKVYRYLKDNGHIKKS